MKCLPLGSSPPEPRALQIGMRESTRTQGRKQGGKLEQEDGTNTPSSLLSKLKLSGCLPSTFIPLSSKSRHSSRPTDFSPKCILYHP